MEEEKKPVKIKKLILNFAEGVHSEVKQRAARRGVSMNLWIHRAIMAAIQEEDKYR